MNSTSSGKQAWWGPHMVEVSRKVPDLYWHTPSEVFGMLYRQIPGPVLCQHNLSPVSYSTFPLQCLSMLDTPSAKFSSGFLGPGPPLSTPSLTAHACRVRRFQVRDRESIIPCQGRKCWRDLQPPQPDLYPWACPPSVSSPLLPTMISPFRISSTWRLQMGNLRHP